MTPAGVTAYPLPDDLYPGSKDWIAADYAGRVEWLHVMYESKKREADSLAERLAAIGVSESRHKTFQQGDTDAPDTPRD